MRKLFLVMAILVSLAITAGAFAQDQTAAPVKEPTLDELQWKALYLQEHIKALQADFQATQEALKQVQAAIKAKQPTQLPKPDEKSKDVPKEKAKK